LVLTFVDSGVLIAAARGQPDLFDPAMAVLGDPQRQFGSSDFVRLEVAPKAAYEGRDAEARFYIAFFSGVARWAPATPDLVGAALMHARKFGLNALDALHVAAAVALGCDELVTSEGPTKPIFRVDVLPVVSIRPPAP
jgi:predicted nucleic acid-binding protein